MREWSDVHQQLARIAARAGLPPNEARRRGERGRRTARSCPGSSAASACGTPSSGVYIGARQTRFPAPPLVGAREEAARVDHGRRARRDLAALRAHRRADRSRRGSRPRAARSASGATASRTGPSSPAQVMAKEHVDALRPPDRRATARSHFGPVDPAASRARCSSSTRSCAREYATRGALHGAQPGALRGGARACATRRGRSDMLADDDAALALLRAARPRRRLQRQDLRGLARGGRGGRPARRSDLSLADVLLDEASRSLARALPRRARRCTAPRCRSPTASIPARTTTASRSPCRSRSCRSSIPGVLEWTIPGWHAEKIALLCHSLPKAVRKALGRCRSSRGARAASSAPSTGPMLPALSRASTISPGRACRPTPWTCTICRRTCASSSASSTSDGQVVGRGARSRASSRSASAPRARGVGRGRSGRAGRARASPGWSFEALPEEVRMRSSGVTLFAYPGAGRRRDVGRPAPSPRRAAADEATRGGLGGCSCCR